MPLKLIRSFPSSILESLSHALSDGRLQPPFTAFSVSEWAPQPMREPLAAELRSLQSLGFTPSTLAVTLGALAEDVAERQRAIDRVQLVWTSPDDDGPHVRDTAVVVRELLSEARQSLWISTYNVFDGRQVFEPVMEAWRAHPNLEVVLVLNIPPGEGAAVGKYSHSFWKYQWPWEQRPAVYYDPRSPEPKPDQPACQHAKCILVDRITAFITSANYTESAHERNIELGVVFRQNPCLVESIHLKFDSLIRNRFLLQMPA